MTPDPTNSALHDLYLFALNLASATTLVVLACAAFAGWVRRRGW